MFRNRIILAFVILLAILSASVCYTVSANYFAGNDNLRRIRVGSALLGSAAAKKNKSKKSPRVKTKNNEHGKNQNRERKVIRLDPNADQTPKGPISKKAEDFAVSPELRSIPEVMNSTPPFAVEPESEEEIDEAKIEQSIRRWLAHGVRTSGGRHRVCKNSLFKKNAAVIASV